MTINEAQGILMIGVAGSGMRGLAFLLTAQGKRVWGADAQWQRESDAVKDRALADVTFVFKDSEIPWDRVDIVVYSDAVPADDGCRLEAEKREILTVSYHRALGQWAADKHVVAVAGTHGKSSTTAFLAYILQQAGLQPNVLIGASTLFLQGGNAELGVSDLLVVEADEYREHFLELRPDVLIITSIDFDHADYFKDFDAVTLAFSKLIAGMPPKGVVIVPASVYETVALPWPERTIVTQESDRLAAPQPLPGEHMQMNAALAVATAKFLEVPHEDAFRFGSAFPGLSRRFELIGHWQGMAVISDYGHHPTEIAATIKAAQVKWPLKNIGVLVEIHTEERLNVFRDEFLQALAMVKNVWLYPVFMPAGRETTRTATSLESLQQDLMERGVVSRLVEGPELVMDELTSAAEEVDILLVFSAGKLDGILRNRLSK